MRDFAARTFLGGRPSARSLYAAVSPIPRFEVRAAAGVTEILLYDEIGWWGVTAKDFVQTLAAAGDGPVLLRINSPGGDVFDGMAIHNAIKARGNVTASIDGLAASAATVVMLGADRVTAEDPAMVMIHRASTITIGNGSDHLESAAVLEKADGQMAALYARKTGKPVADLLSAMNATTWFTAEEARLFGLVDQAETAPSRSAPPQSAAASQGAAIVAIEEIERRRRALRLAAAR